MLSVFHIGQSLYSSCCHSVLMNSKGNVINHLPWPSESFLPVVLEMKSKHFSLWHRILLIWHRCISLVLTFVTPNPALYKLFSVSHTHQPHTCQCNFVHTVPYSRNFSWTLVLLVNFSFIKTEHSFTFL